MGGGLYLCACLNRYMCLSVCHPATSTGQDTSHGRCLSRRQSLPFRGGATRVSLVRRPGSARPPRPPSRAPRTATSPGPGSALPWPFPSSSAITAARRRRHGDASFAGPGYALSTRRRCFPRLGAARSDAGSLARRLGPGRADSRGHRPFALERLSLPVFAA